MDWSFGKMLFFRGIASQDQAQSIQYAIDEGFVDDPDYNNGAASLASCTSQYSKVLDLHTRTADKCGQTATLKKADSSMGDLTLLAAHERTNTLLE